MQKLLKSIIKKFCSRIFDLHIQNRDETTREKYAISPSVAFYNLSLEGNIYIGDFTYVNESSRMDSGPNSKITIGRHCAIGRYVHVTAKSHDLTQPTTDEDHNEIMHYEEDVLIGDYVWIGDKALVKPGVTIGNYAVIGANSVVTKNVLPFEVVGGVPARHIKFNTRHYKYSR